MLISAQQFESFESTFESTDSIQKFINSHRLDSQHIHTAYLGEGGFLCYLRYNQYNQTKNPA